MECKHYWLVTSVTFYTEKEYGRFVLESLSVMGVQKWLKFWWGGLLSWCIA